MKKTYLVTISLLLAACSTFQNAAVTEMTTLYEHNWELSTIDDDGEKNMSSGNFHATLKLDFPENGQGRVIGEASCNRHFGTYDLVEHSIKISWMASTLMACTDLAMKQEQFFFSRLEQVTHLEHNEGTLILTNEFDDKSLTFKAGARLTTGKIISETDQLSD